MPNLKGGGLNRPDGLSLAGGTLTGSLTISSGNLALASNAGTIVLGASADVILARDAAAVLALKNGTTAQEFRVYGTTTGPKYLSLQHDGTQAVLRTNSGGGSLYLGVQGDNYWSVDGSSAGLVSLSNRRFSHGISALATNATEGFLHIQSCAGAPTGVPASIPAGQVPMVIDTTNDRIYFYYDDGGGVAWHYVNRTA